MFLVKIFVSILHLFSARLNLRRRQTAPMLMQRIDTDTDVIDNIVFELDCP